MYHYNYLLLPLFAAWLALVLLCRASLPAARMMAAAVPTHKQRHLWDKPEERLIRCVDERGDHIDSSLLTHTWTGHRESQLIPGFKCVPCHGCRERQATRRAHAKSGKQK
jgi:hypothetical protein